MRTGLNKRGLLASASVAALMLADTTGATAQDAAQDQGTGFVMEELVVTARRRAESILDVPGTVTALSETALRNAGVKRAEDFIALTPGVTLVDAAEVGDTQINIRGINGARDAENSVAFIIDGVLYTNPAAFNREFTDLQQIEIFKGPQGAIYGRNAAAGAIIVTTQRPTNEWTGFVEGSAGNNESFQVKGTVSGPIVEDELFFRLSADWSDTNGFFRNSFQDNAAIVDRFENYNINGRILWEPTPDLSVDVKARYGQVDASAISFNATFQLPVFAAGGSPAAFEDVNEHEFVFQPNIVSDNDQDAIEISTKADYDFGWASLTGWMLYSDIDNEFIADGTSAGFGFFQNDPACIQSTADLNAAGLTLPPPQVLGTSPGSILFDANGSFFGPYTPTTCDGLQEQVRFQRDISFEFRLASPGDQDLRWMAGFYFLDIDRQVGVSLARDSGEAPIRGLVQPTGPNRTEALVFDDFDSRVWAVFGQLQYDVTDDIELSAALRYDRESRQVSSLVPTDVFSTVIDTNGDTIINDPSNPDPLNPALVPALNPNLNPDGTLPDLERVFEQVQPKVSVTWDVLDELTLFASWGVGFKAGGFNNQGSAATVDAFINGLAAPFAADLGLPLVSIQDDFEEETSNAVEAGFKARLFDGRLQLEGAGYYTNVDDMQFFEFFVGTFGLLRVVSNIDDVEIYGVELAASYQMNEYVSLYGGFNIVESEINANSARPDTVGNEAPYTPDYTINVGAEFTYPTTDTIRFLSRIDAQFIGPTWFHTVQDQQRPTIFQAFFEQAFGAGGGALAVGDFSNTLREDYFTIDIRVGFETDTWSIIGFARNLTDEEFLEEVIPAPEFGGTFVHPGNRRSWGFELAYRF